jgi:hypothetical protein
MLARALGRVVSVGPLKALFIPVTPLIFRAQVETLRSARSTGALLHAGRTCPKEPNMVSCACWQGCTTGGGGGPGVTARRSQKMFLTWDMRWWCAFCGVVNRNLFFSCELGVHCPS